MAGCRGGWAHMVAPLMQWRSCSDCALFVLPRGNLGTFKSTSCPSWHLGSPDLPALIVPWCSTCASASASCWLWRALWSSSTRRQAMPQPADTPSTVHQAPAIQPHTQPASAALCPPDLISPSRLNPHPPSKFLPCRPRMPCALSVPRCKWCAWGWARTWPPRSWPFCRQGVEVGGAGVRGAHHVKLCAWISPTGPACTRGQSAPACPLTFRPLAQRAVAPAGSPPMSTRPTWTTSFGRCWC